MKFVKVIVLFALAVLLCACGEKKISLFEGDVTATVSYALSGREYTVKYSRLGESEKLEVLEPKRIRGLIAERENGEVTVSYTDLEYTSVSDKMFAPFELFSPMTMKKDGDNSFVSEGGDVRVCFDGETPKTLSGNNFTLEILEFREE
ncbi:MAG: hypothetical protein IKU61_00535 [Clostridia bacterium]|nr:hypothetical protein [Clostridia bacterium]